MKKLLCLIVALVLTFSFTACGKKKTDDSHTVDIEYYAKLGKMPEAQYGLGDAPKTIIKEMNEVLKKEEAEHKEDPNHEHGHDEAEFYFDVMEGSKNVLLDNGNICYYYNKANEDKGVSYIVNYDTAFGFPIGTVSVEIEKALSEFKPVEETPNDENAFFVGQLFGGSMLKVEIEGSTILFVFQENELFATAIYNENWSN